MTETPNYELLRKDKHFEVRYYPGYIRAEVQVKNSDYRTALYRGFNILASFIFGNNQQTKELAMTAPVQVSSSTQIKMTKPVTIQEDDSDTTVAFIMPSKYSLDTLPIPNNNQITFKQVEPHTMGVQRFSGYFSKVKVKKVKQMLLERLNAEGYKTKDMFIVARYNPPWIPWFLARDEVMIQIETSEDHQESTK